MKQIMKAKIIFHIKLIVLFTIAIQNLSNACSCWPYEPVFCRIVDEWHHVVRAVVTSHPDYYLMKVQLLENINKEITEDTIIIYGQDGLSCGESTDQFNINDTLILAVVEWEIDGAIYWYLEGFCGLHFLRYENEMVMGQITDTLTIQPIQDFRDNLFDCLAMPLPIKEIEGSKSELSIFPNPVLEKLQISTIENLISGYDLYDSNGQLIISEVLNQSVEKHDINADDLRTGIYYIRIKTSKGVLARKFIKT
jgi:Secretion system C-terminal sorting domain